MTGEVIKIDGPRRAPASGGKAKQLVVFLHGLGADGGDLISLVPHISRIIPDAAFASPHAPFPCDMAPTGLQWFSLAEMSMASLLAGAEMARPILDNFLDSELAAHDLTPDKLAVFGFSQGAMMALHCCLRRSAPVGAIIGCSGLLIAPENLAGEIKARPPVTLLHGTEDMVVPFQSMDAAEQSLKALGVAVQSFARPGLGHGIDQEGLSLAAEHLRQALS